MRIAVHAEGRSIRGHEAQLLLVAGGLLERGHEVFASCVAGSPLRAELDRLGARTTGVRPRGDADLLALLRFARWLRRVRPDAVLLTSWRRLATAAAAARLAGAPRVVLRLGGTHPLPPGPKRIALRRWVAAVWVNSGAVRTHLLRVAPRLPPQRVVVIANGIAPIDVRPAALRASLGLPPDARLVLGAGGLERRKGFDILLEALAMLPPAVHLAIAGEGPERAALETRARRPDLAGRVHLLGRRDDTRALMRDADVFALASRSEGMPVVVLEAMAAGLPVVATAVAGTDELLAGRPGGPPAGWVVPVDDAATLAGALAATLAGDGEARDRAREAARRAREEFAPDRMVDAVEALLRGG